MAKQVCRLSLILATAAMTCMASLPSAARPYAQGAHDRLYRLFKDSDEATLRRNPLQALFRGDFRYADHLGDRFSDDHFAAERAASEDDLAVLHSIRREKLSPTDRLAYDTFEYNLKDNLAYYGPGLARVNAALPMNHFFGLHTAYPSLSSGSGAAPYKTLPDYENGLSRNHDFVRNLDMAIVQWRRGRSDGVVDTKVTVSKMIDQLNTQLGQRPEDSPYYGPVKQFPQSIGSSDRARLTAAYRNAILNEIYPALARLRDFLKTEYLPHARDGVGLMYMTGGGELYRYLVRTNTTLPLEPDEVHELGLAEVARITREFEKTKNELGFKGDLHEFFEFMRTSPKFQPKTRQQLTQDYYRIKARVEPRIPRFFRDVPKARLVIRPVPEFRQEFASAGSYDQGTPDGSRPGIFYFNAFNLPSRSTWRETTLFLHEGEPGHHFQISLAQENKALPSFMRFGGSTAFAEGWALYAESLGYDMGLYKDPYQRFGTLNYEMLRAMRLVVDTAIHSKGWDRDRAINYMLEHSGMNRSEATTEVDRYIGNPGQALAYKIGALTIQRLREKARDELGPRFDIREFHSQVLDSGALPLSVLEAKITDWIAAKKQLFHSRSGQHARDVSKRTIPRART